MWRNLDPPLRVTLTVLLFAGFVWGVGGIPWHLLPFTLADERMDNALELTGKGQCREAIPVLVSLGESKDPVAYQILGDIYSSDSCGLKDMSLAIEYYRKSAASGNCWGNAALAHVALQYPGLASETPISPEGNFLAATLCEPDASSDDITAFYYGDTHDRPLPPAFLMALGERGVVLGKSITERLALVGKIANGDGFDRNPTPLQQLTD